MRIITNKPTKLCHCPPGTAIRLIRKDGTTGPEIYMICLKSTTAPEGFAPAGAPVPPINTGLYAVRGTLNLVNLETGILSAMPNLSTRVAPAHDVGILSLDSLGQEPVELED
jgi:hypothetical protein